MGILYPSPSARHELTGDLRQLARIIYRVAEPLW